MEPNHPTPITVLPGDGIGAEVMQATIPIFACLKIPVTLTFGDIGWLYWQQEGTPIPARTWRLIEEAEITLLGAITSKPEREAHQELAINYQVNPPSYVSPIIQLRQTLDLYANIRPCFNISGKKNFNFCIIRENTEGLYAGFDYNLLPDALYRLINENKRWLNVAKEEISCSLRLQTTNGLKRIFAFAFCYAHAHGMQRVTFADKPNVLRKSSAFAREIFESVASQYPHIRADILNVDAVALWLIKRPEAFGVIVAENMFADILSDVGAAVMGGLGFAPSKNVGEKGCYCEPVHGSGPHMQKNSANPSAMFLTIGMLLEHLGYKEQAEMIKQAVIAIVTERRYVTYDLGGTSTTQEMANAIISYCHHLQ